MVVNSVKIPILTLVNYFQQQICDARVSFEKHNGPNYRICNFQLVMQGDYASIVVNKITSELRVFFFFCTCIFVCIFIALMTENCQSTQNPYLSTDTYAKC